MSADKKILPFFLNFWQNPTRIAALCWNKQVNAGPIFLWTLLLQSSALHG